MFHSLPGANSSKDGDSNVNLMKNNNSGNNPVNNSTTNTGDSSGGNNNGNTKTATEVSKITNSDGSVSASDPLSTGSNKLPQSQNAPQNQTSSQPQLPHHHRRLVLCYIQIIHLLICLLLETNLIH